MIPKYDPIHKLCDHQAIRFIGTIGDVTRHISRIHAALIRPFSTKEVRNSRDLERLIAEEAGCKPIVARNTLQVATLLDLLDTIPAVKNASNQKLTLGEAGRVVLAIMHDSNFTEAYLPNALFRPMFEAHGDYLLQALEAIQQDELPAVKAFEERVKALPAAKIADHPANKTGEKWQMFRRAIGKPERAAQRSGAHPTLKELQKEADSKRQQYLRKSRLSSSKQQGASADPKTFEHHFARCRAWLVDLGMAVRAENAYRLTEEGERSLHYFHTTLPSAKPVHIPPTATLLSDCFRLTDDEIISAWGIAVDEEFWENARWDFDRIGSYEPTMREFDDSVDSVFTLVKLPLVPEASIPAIRQVLFHRYVLANRPIRPSRLTALLLDTIDRRRDLYGTGRNRHGREVFLFRRN